MSLLAALLAGALAAPLPEVPDPQRWFTEATRVEVTGRDAQCAEAVEEAVAAVRKRLARRDRHLGVFVDPDTGTRVTDLHCDGRRARVQAIGVTRGGKRFPRVSATRLAEVAQLLGPGLARVRFELRAGELWLVQGAVDGGMGLSEGDYVMLAMAGDWDWLRGLPEIAGLGVDLVGGDDRTTAYRFRRADLEAFDAGELDADTILARGRAAAR